MRAEGAEFEIDLRGFRAPQIVMDPAGPARHRFQMRFFPVAVSLYIKRRHRR